jgi:hypothetical protein
MLFSVNALVSRTSGLLIILGLRFLVVREDNAVPMKVAFNIASQR